MNIYLLTQEENSGYDTYDSMVVIAKNEAIARTIHPNEIYKESRKDIWQGAIDDIYTCWASKPENVQVFHVGKANTGTNEGIVCASFNAG